MPARVVPLGNGVFRVGDGPQRTAWAAPVGNGHWVFLDGKVYVIEPALAGARRRLRSSGGPLAAPMPATVRKINVAAGDAVKSGDVLLVLEAMKMELPVRASTAGVVSAVHCSEGELVQPGVPLVTMESR